MNSNQRSLILLGVAVVVPLVLMFGGGEAGGIILILGGIALAAGLISFFILWLRYWLIWGLGSVLISVFIGVVAVSQPAGGGFMPGLGRFILLYGVLAPILVGWLAGAGYQRFYGRKARAMRETKDVET